MGDTSHLEKMGRELKCPICLGLFDSAASLSCNHVFCNACIVKSMKMDAKCPVCKIPYHRRDIRAAPHMDSLVSIYKSMEDASGVNIFVSQSKPSSSEKEKYVRAASVKKADRTCQRAGRSRIAKGKDRKNKEIDLDAPGLIVLKPSSQTKKRVQLSQHLSSESSPESTGYAEIAAKHRGDTEKTMIGLDDHPYPNEEGNLHLSPFFWLGDEDVEERISQLEEGDELLDITPVEVPSFSDLKDSDDENLSKGDEQEQPNPGDMFDSEMFEWTQRPSSPEILPSPVKAKVPDRGESGLTQRKLPKVTSEKITKRKAASSRNTTTTRGVEISQDYSIVSAAVENIGQKQDACGSYGTSNRLVGTPVENVKVKRDTLRKGKVSGVQACLNKSKVADGKQGTKRKRSRVKSSAAQQVAGSNDLSLGTETVEKGDQKRALGLTDTQPKTQNPAKKSSVKTKGRKSNANAVSKDLSGNSVNKTSVKRSKLHSPLNQVGEGQDSANRMKSTVDKGKDSTQVSEKSSTRNKHSLEGSAPLRRCDAPLTNKFSCAFCQSSEDTEGSGEMTHYYNGGPVSADFDGGSKVIHVHKNCAEWAPNVYFSNLTAVNLDVELTRSRRINCSGCGLKGAALGCYNKSCKNSFHVPCAKLIPECRWDTENFVMLCPLDASSKLPCEETSPKGRKRKRTPKGPLQSQSIQVAEKAEITELQSKHFHGFTKKMVLSCSGLAIEEESVISEFAELSGVSILRKWEPNVTHVIASINENGACKRTLKFMMAILEGKWILTIDWIKACIRNKKHVKEEPYEISMDVHGIRNGPRVGRRRVLNKKPKLFNGLSFYIMGDFESAYRGYLQDLVIAAGGTILRRRPISGQAKSEPSTFIIYSSEPIKGKSLSQSESDAEALAKSTGAKAVSSSWVLDSIAACLLHKS